MGNCLRSDQLITVGERCLFHRPRRLELIRSGSPLAPAKIKSAQSFVAALSYQTPVHEIIRRIFVEFRQCRAVIGHDLIPEVEAEDARDSLALLANPEE